MESTKFISSTTLEISFSVQFFVFGIKLCSDVLMEVNNNCQVLHAEDTAMVSEVL